jgi:hypothetical protein
MRVGFFRDVQFGRSDDELHQSASGSKPREIPLELALGSAFSILRESLQKKSKFFFLVGVAFQSLRGGCFLLCSGTRFWIFAHENMHGADYVTRIHQQEAGWMIKRK